MKKILSLVSIVTVLATALPAAAQVKTNYIGPAVSFGSGDTAIGVTSKFGVADSISVRPFALFPSGGTIFGASASYDFNLNDGSGTNPVTPYGGIGFVTSSAAGSRSEVYFEIGADFEATESIALNANYRFRDG
jgi:opacity protein-like surface antigen